jgi:type III secretory pathway component EscR
VCTMWKPDDVNRLLFECPMAQFVWVLLSEALGWTRRPTSINNLTNVWLTGGLKVSFQIGLTCFARFAWAIWLTRNKMCISQIFPNKPINIIHLGVSFVQSWKILARSLAKSRMEQMMERVTEFANSFRPSDCIPHDVGFL